ncbi:AraC family transcriptional regulator [Vibrio sp. WXL210]|uniref:AraC family transcriptional regulator n=1 Tax=Vibrio sp. WXL210 TaxID=3450709 RepID=UPI003EC717D5
MAQPMIKQLIESKMVQDGWVESGIHGVRLFRVTQSIPCAPAVYEPMVIAIVNGSKEAIVDGKRHVYDSRQYLSCSVSMPVEAGTPQACPESPLLGVSIAIETTVMRELVVEFERHAGAIKSNTKNELPEGLTLASWDTYFSDALLRVLELADDPVDSAILAQSRLRELYYAILKGEGGAAFRRAFGVGNEIARSIEYLSSHIGDNVTIEQLASQVSMSRAVFHRKFKQATMMSPIQFIKSMRLNHAAMKIASGMNVSAAALTVGYVSSSQFSREFKRLYGQSPKQWAQSQQPMADMA